MKALDARVVGVVLEVDQHGNVELARDGVDRLHGLGIARDWELLLADSKSAQPQVLFEHLPRLGNVRKFVREEHEPVGKPSGQFDDGVVAVRVGCQAISGACRQQYGQIHAHGALMSDQCIIGPPPVVRVLVKVDD